MSSVSLLLYSCPASPSVITTVPYNSLLSYFQPLLLSPPHVLTKYRFKSDLSLHGGAQCTWKSHLFKLHYCRMRDGRRVNCQLQPRTPVSMLRHGSFWTRAKPISQCQPNRRSWPRYVRTRKTSPRASSTRKVVTGPSNTSCNFHIRIESGLSHVSL